MRMRSDGLGRTELEAQVVKVKRVGDLLIVFADTTKPVKWKTRMGFQQGDLRGLVLAMFTPKNLWFILKALLFPKRELPRTESF